MSVIRQLGVMIILGVFTLSLFGCNSKSTNYSPEQVINNALEETTPLGSYYAEAESITSEKGEEIEQGVMREWRADDGKVRIEMENKDGTDTSIAVNDGSTFLMYQVEQEQAFIIDDPELLAFNQPSLKEQADALLEMVRDTHEISVVGEEEIASRSTYHIVAKVKEDGGLFGDQEMWIDKENWMVLKMIFNSGDSIAEMVYTKIEFKDTIPAETFTLDLPDQVEVKNMEDINQTSEITLDEVAENIGKPVFYFPEKDGLEITTIEKSELTGELEHVEVSIDYKKDDLPLLTMSVFTTPEDLAEDLNFPGEESVMVRDQEGSYMDSDIIRSLLWQEDGLSYSIILIDPNLTLEELETMTDGMELVE